MGQRIAFQGEFGAFSEEAVRRWDPAATAVPCPTFRAVCTAVERGEAALGVLPIENSRAGSVLEVYDILMERPLRICGEVAVRVEHCLLAPPQASLSDLRRVYSHPQALAQCEQYLRGLGVEAVAVYDTAGGARTVALAAEPNAGAIASARAAELYGLTVLARAIQDDPENTTRFYVVGPESTGRPGDAGTGTEHRGPHRTVVALALRDDESPGALFWCLASLAYWRINLLKVESRPSRRRPWHYLFYLDLAAAAEDAACAAALDELRARTTLLRVLGSFPRDSMDR